jgi:hypothetical protein
MCVVNAKVVVLSPYRSSRRRFLKPKCRTELFAMLRRPWLLSCMRMGSLGLCLSSMLRFMMAFTRFGSSLLPSTHVFWRHIPAWLRSDSFLLTLFPRVIFPAHRPSVRPLQSQRIWATRLHLRLTNFAASFFFFDFVMKGMFDEVSGRYLTGGSSVNNPSSVEVKTKTYLSFYSHADQVVYALSFCFVSALMLRHGRATCRSRQHRTSGP